MTASLSTVPVAKRKQLAATLGLFSVLFVAVGAVAATGPATTVIRTFVVGALIVAVLLAMMAWGVVHTIRDELTEQHIDALIEDAVAAAPGYGSLCSCGHEHDPTELHITGADCAADGSAVDSSGHECSQTCDTCVLASLRPSPRHTREQRLTR